MKNHTTIRGLLYDYVCNQLDPDRHHFVETHLASCPACSESLKRVQAAVAILRRPENSPADVQSQEYWNGFVAAVDSRIRQEKVSPAPARRYMEELIGTLMMFRRRYALAAAGALAVLFVAFLVWQQLTPREEQQLAQETVKPTRAVESASNRMDQYLRRSKALLVGIENMKTGDGHSIDLSAERNASRNLVREARYFRRQRLDPRSQKLMGDLEKILIELSNAHETGNAPDVELLRNGIQQENLLFKIRMAENTARFANARYTAPHEKQIAGD